MCLRLLHRHRFVLGIQLTFRRFAMTCLGIICTFRVPDEVLEGQKWLIESTWYSMGIELLKLKDPGTESGISQYEFGVM